MGQLNPAQSEAVGTLGGPLLVLAGAGTGKTRVITFRVANLIKHGTAADRILAVTFTNKAAMEMQERISGQLKLPKRVRRGQPAPARPQIGTFHSHCVQILKRWTGELGYPDRFTIYDRSDAESVARTVLREIRVAESTLSPSDFLNIVSRWKNAGVRPENADSAATSDQEHIAASGFRRYQRALKLQAAFDFDDLLVFAEQLLVENPKVRLAEAGRYDHVLVDEYQDTNGCQYRIIKALAQGHRNLCVVGDDDQSIYGWRGAEVRHILNFRQDWPEAKVVRLEDNYRSTDAILTMSKRLRVDKTVSPGDFAILFRTNEQPRPFEMELRKRKVPYMITGSQSFFDRKEVRDLLAYLRWIDSPDDELALLRVINVPPRGMGAGSVDKLLKQAVATSSSVWKVMHDEVFSATLPTAAQGGIASLKELQSRYKAQFDGHLSAHQDPSQVPSMAEVLIKLIDDLKYREEIQRLYAEPEEAAMRIGSLESVLNSIAQYEESAAEPTLDDFLASIVLSGREYGSGKDKQQGLNAVSLMTYHSAKGLEFPIVYMIGMEEGVLPHRRSISGEIDSVDEERRLCYVGVTRAQDELALSLPQSRFKWGKPRPTYPSRFLYELTGQGDHPNRIKSIQAAAQEAKKSGRTKR
ncbi:MAG: UvrD-helicase domain-containing protein [Pirellula sp.]|nr:UvrD-helicase domain-containing protein [Pirellula sp.]